MSDLLKLPEISEQTGVPINTLRSLRASGRGPKTFMLAGRVVAKREDVNAWVQEQYDAADIEATA
ncbi:helix-turn-helix transcriptional regulator [Cellulomonas endometrii]|uniref:helix-turn-helix transcriptional regulator n=1 Tax=Cellulomonas endometrii TaxID=3036301 RepID=UPI0024AD56A2|nr:helix-turn-helix domain-containing protein [Cellulomonas endometrii]